MSRKIKIIIAGGGTGGHLFPGIAIAEEFAGRRDCEILFVGSKKGLESRIIPKTNFSLSTIPVSGLYRVGLKRKIISLLQIPLALIKSLWIVLSFQPDLVIGVGGYASGPLLLVAILLRKNTIVQEQNAYPGMTNRILGKYVSLAFVPFKYSENIFKKAIVSGNPIRNSIKPRDIISSKDQEIVISIIGGSQGAHIINRNMVEILPDLRTINGKIRIIHQTGKSDYEWVKSEYEKFSEIKAQIEPFFEDINSVYEQTDLIISRSGSVINEIITVGLASILIPINRSSGNHQRENAKKLKAAKAAIMIEEDQLTSTYLFQQLKELIANPATISEMSKKARSLYQGKAAEIIVSSTLEFFRL